MAQNHGEQSHMNEAAVDDVVVEFERVMAAAADGDLSARVDADIADDRFARIARLYNEMAAELASTLRTVHSFSGDVSNMSQGVESDSNLVEASSHRVSSRMDDISSLTDRQSDELQQISHEMSDLSASGEEMAAATNEVAEKAQEATQRGEEGKEAAERALEEIRQVESTSDAIVDRISDLESPKSTIFSS